MTEYTPSLKSIESAYVAQRVSKGSDPQRAREEFKRGIAAAQYEVKQDD